MDEGGGREVLRAEVRRILSQGRPGTTMCPSDVARKLDPVGWRRLMPEVRDAAYRLADAGQVEVLQRGEVVDGRTVRGPIRLRLR